MNALIRTIEIMGIIAFALTGIYEARKKGMDIVGVYAVAMITAFGGGSLRDLILNRHPLFWIEHYGYAMLLLALSVVTVLAVRNFFASNRFTRAVLVLDALGLGLFSASGTSVARQTREPLVHRHAPRRHHRRVRRRDAGHHLQRDPPRVHAHRALCHLRARRLVRYLLVFAAAGSEIAAVLACICVTFALRMFAVRYDIRLPL